MHDRQIELVVFHFQRLLFAFDIRRYFLHALMHIQRNLYIVARGRRADQHALFTCVFIRKTTDEVTVPLYALDPAEFRQRRRIDIEAVAAIIVHHNAHTGFAAFVLSDQKLFRKFLLL